ncbi:MAG TPA: WD40 repeat domain-containing protein [Coleofasciculaceae cyanobacterium]
MRLLPYDSFTLQTPDPLPIVLERLATQVESEKLIRWQFSRNHLPYEGSYSEAGFKIHRIIHYRNSFLPIIRGQFETSRLGTTVHITMRLHPFVTVFLGFWYLVWYGFSLPIWLTGAMPTAFALQFLGLPVLILLIFWIAFWAEASRSRHDLTQMILGQVNHTSRNLNRWLPNVMQWGAFLLGLAIALLQMTAIFHLFPSGESGESASLGTASCSQNPSHSSLCNFTLVQTITGHPAAAALAMSRDGQTLVSGGSDKAIKVWDLKTGQLRNTLQSDSGSINAVALSPDGQTVISGSADHRVRIWDLTHNSYPRILTGHPEEVNWVGVTPDGKTVISGSYGAIKQWDLATGRLKATFPKVGKSETTMGPISLINDEAERFNPLDINPNSNTALISDLKLVDLASNQIRTIPTDKVENLFTDHFLSAHLSPNGKLAALQYGNNFRKFETRLKVWDLTTGAVRAMTQATFSHHTFADLPLALSNHFIFGSADRQLKVWNLQTAQLEAVLDTGWMSSLVVTPDGKFLVGLSSNSESDKSQIKVWQHQSK